jgi:hypothetical protein
MTPSTKRTIFLGLALVASAVVLFWAWPAKESFLYEQDLKTSEFRCKVFSTRSFDIMPGSGGPGVVRIYNAKGELVFKHSIKTTLSEISVSEDELVITGEGVWPLKNLRR